MEDIKKLITKEVSRQRSDERATEDRLRMIEHSKRADQRRSRPPESVVITWGAVGTLPVPRPVQGPPAAMPRISEQEASPAPPSTIVTRMHPGPKPGKAADAQRAAWQIAERILFDPDRRPARGHGRLKKLVKLIKPEMENAGYGHLAETIRKQISPSLREWERKNGL